MVQLLAEDETLQLRERRARGAEGAAVSAAAGSMNE
jgi:hypothetical protein